jgi:NNP family nitrate/nitrite transporter-like MFS transporter
VIGLVGAIGAFGGYAIQQVFRIGSGHPDWPLPALVVFTGFYVVCAVLTWWVYLRRSLLVTRVSSLAHANV